MTVLDTNLLGTVHGGVVMKLVDDVAGVVAQRHSGGPAVTASMDEMDFLEPVRVGDLVHAEPHRSTGPARTLDGGRRPGARRAVERGGGRTGAGRHGVPRVRRGRRGRPSRGRSRRCSPETAEDRRRFGEAEIRRDAPPGPARRPSCGPARPPAGADGRQPRRDPLLRDDLGRSAARCPSGRRSVRSTARCSARCCRRPWGNRSARPSRCRPPLTAREPPWPHPASPTRWEWRPPVTVSASRRSLSACTMSTICCSNPASFDWIWPSGTSVIDAAECGTCAQTASIAAIPASLSGPSRVMTSCWASAYVDALRCSRS